VTGDPTRDLVDRLALELEPVRPLRPLPARLAPVLAVSLALATGVALVTGLRADLVKVLLGDWTFTGVLAGLLLAASGGCAAALASVIPGRELTTRFAGAVAGSGVAIGLAVAAAGTTWGGAGLEAPLSSLAGCLVRGVALAILPALLGLWLAARGWSARPALTVSLSLLGAGSIGALLVHVSCPALDPLHVLSTHVSSPLLLVAVATAVFVPLLRRRAR
jgi:hypothetical protein